MGQLDDEVVLAFLAAYIQRNQRAPSYREIAEGVGCAVRTAYLAVQRLIERGLVEDEPGQHRSLRLTG